jgi:hypothetical protein
VCAGKRGLYSSLGSYYPSGRNAIIPIFFFRKNRIKKENNRPSVKDLLNDTEFFCKTRRNGSEGGRSALNEAMARTSKSVRFRLRVLAPKKRRDQHEENEMRRLRPSSSSSTQWRTMPTHLPRIWFSVSYLQILLQYPSFFSVGGLAIHSFVSLVVDFSPMN